MIELRDVTLARGEKTILEHISASLPDAGVVALLGPSGSGKTTLTLLFAGLLAPAAGTFRGMEGKRVAVVFQEDRLLPWLSAKENVALADGERSVADCLSLVELDGEAEKYPRRLSGGMQRRVAIARALRLGGDALVLDEPFKGLDAELRERVAKRLAAAFPLIFIATHDESEAALLGDYTKISLG
ncbi:MAG TPA: ATP-binding cassette domain-containing protein [Clostridia bacterium]|nr:MAG: Aliphatic sulfonates import ATP-binding protein SsuB [Firmicutes bacterium ADurb.Bin248]HOG01754.1 ATP-binding cassette domain-containing protein [Clostridia bacterium]HOS18968.1 ATP-binding cassette domain-containing protein [Clostridia bacterium]HPK14590.1 ATP-binding cassette domain-containing protein [Clostridia bacterium]